MKIISLFLVLSLWSFNLLGQTIEPFSLISNANYYALSVQGVSLHSSLGELAIETLDADDTHLSQGFLQTYFEDIVSTSQGTEEALRLTVGPNPFVDRVNIHLESANGLQGALYDLYGRLLRTFPLHAGDNLLDGGTLPAGTYLLRIGRAEETLFQTIKLVKL